MNWNAIRTFLLGSGIITMVVPYLVSATTTFLGCSGDNPLTPELELTICTGGALVAIPLWLQATVAAVVLSALGLIKAFTGTGSVKQNLLNNVAPIVMTRAEEKVGVVSEAQVAAPGPAK